MAAKQAKFERFKLPSRRAGKRQRKTWIVTADLVERVVQTAARRQIDESEVVMRAIEQYLPDPGAPKRRRKADVDAGASEPAVGAGEEPEAEAA